MQSLSGYPLPMRVLDSGIDNSTGLVSDHHVRLTGVLSTTRYPEALQCGTFIDEQTDKQFDDLRSLQQRWQVEVGFELNLGEDYRPTAPLSVQRFRLGRRWPLLGHSFYGQCNRH
jgi:hypothetical protein